MMQSKISLEIDLNNNRTPYLQILHSNSDDLRDQLLADFLQSLGHTSRWCRIEYESESIGPAATTKRWRVTTVAKRDLMQELKLMKAVIESSVAIEQPKDTVHKFGDDVKEPQYKDMVYQCKIKNPYPGDSQSHAAFEKGFEECFWAFSQAEKNPNLSSK